MNDDIHKTIERQNYLVDRFAEVAPLFLSDKGRCMVIMPPEAKDGFDSWLEKYRDTALDDADVEIYSGFATFGGYFAICLADRADIIQDILSAIGVYETGNYIVVHKPDRKSGAVKMEKSFIEVPHAP